MAVEAMTRVDVEQVRPEHRDSHQRGQRQIDRRETDGENDIGRAGQRIACPGREQDDWEQRGSEREPPELSATAAVTGAVAAYQVNREGSQRDGQPWERHGGKDVSESSGHRAEYVGRKLIWRQKWSRRRRRNHYEGSRVEQDDPEQAATCACRDAPIGEEQQRQGDDDVDKDPVALAGRSRVSVVRDGRGHRRLRKLAEDTECRDETREGEQWPQRAVAMSSYHEEPCCTGRSPDDDGRGEQQHVRQGRGLRDQPGGTYDRRGDERRDSHCQSTQPRHCQSVGRIVGKMPPCWHAGRTRCRR
jgi:hypothetical protein